MPRRGEATRAQRDKHARIRAMVDEHIDLVARTLRQAGVPRSDLDDEIQRTFMVVTNRIDDLHAGAERSFLFQVAHNVASHARRKMARRREILDDPPERIEAVATPEFLTDRKRLRTMLDDMIGSLQEPLRAVFILFGFEGMNLSEISRALRLPRGTVASRLRRARAQLRAHIAAADLDDYLQIDDAADIAEPRLLRLERVSALQRALLAAGARSRAPATTYARTLGALGFAAPASRPSVSPAAGRCPRVMPDLQERAARRVS